MEFFNSIQQVKSNWEPYKQWEKEQKDKEFQRRELNKNVPASKEELDKASQYGRTLIDSINTMDQYSINKSEDVEMTTQLATGMIEMALMTLGLITGVGILKTKGMQNYIKKNPKNKMPEFLVSLLAPLAPLLVASPFLQVKFASYQKEASRIARYQAREKELSDPKNFVVYNDEQIAEAKEIAKTLPEPADKKKKSLDLFSNYGTAMNSIQELQKEHNNYLAWKKESLKKEEDRKNSLDTIQATPEQLQKAKADQDNLLRVIKKVEINSQNYLTKVETACDIATFTAIAIGTAGGGLATWILNALEKSKKIKPSEMINNIKKYSPLAIPVVLLAATASYTTKIQKDAARIGRFKAKQELLNDPHNFITYNDDQLNSVKDLKAPPEPNKTGLEKIKDGIKFFFNLSKDYKEYENYQKHQGKEEIKLQQALKQVNVSDEQIKKAKEFQKNSFMAFEKVDEMTQRYVDDTEAATDIAKQYIGSGINIGGSILTVYLLFKTIKKNPKNAKNIQWTIMLPTILSILAQVPLEIKSMQIQQQAAKIGIMNAAKDLQDPRYFVNND